MERRLGPTQNFWSVFVAHCESCAEDIKAVFFVIRVLPSCSF